MALKRQIKSTYYFCYLVSDHGKFQPLFFDTRFGLSEADTKGSQRSGTITKLNPFWVTPLVLRKGVGEQVDIK